MELSNLSSSASTSTSGKKRPRPLPFPGNSSRTLQSDATILLNKTWVIRSISPFTLPFLKFSSPSAGIFLSFTPRGHEEEEEEEDEESSFMSRQVHMSHFFRQRHPTATNKKGRTEDEGDDGSETFVTLSWLTLSSNIVTENTNDRTATTASANPHVYIHVTLKDQVVSHLVLCYPIYITTKSTSNCTEKVLQSFSYILHRGNAHVLSTIYTYLETTFGCRVSPNVFHPLSSDVMSSMAQWSVMSFLHHKKQVVSQNSYDKKSTNNKPMEVTFQTPQQIQEQGLSTITITIPPVSLERLYTSIVENIKKKCQNDSNQNDIIINETNTGSNNSATVSVPETMTSITTLPTLRAIQYFMYDSFHIDITSFPLTRVSCNDVGIIGCDGRIKLFSLTCVDMILKGIRDMVIARYSLDDKDEFG